jgi:chloramphenicol O-acetyltransferase type A
MLCVALLHKAHLLRIKQLDQKTVVSTQALESDTIRPMPKYLDTATWARREVFEFFRDFDKPYFNVCISLDISNLLTLLHDRGSGNVSLAYHYFALRMANEIEPLRYRLRDGKVVVHEVIHGGTTVLLPNQSFGLAYFDYIRDFDHFLVNARSAVNDARSKGAFSPMADDARIHFTTLPWLSFTSFSHARNWGREDSVPKIAFGKFTREHNRILLPFSVEVHHALVDGLHVGQFVGLLEEALRSPEAYLA